MDPTTMSPHSIAVLKRQKLVPAWAEKWKTSLRHAKMLHIDPMLPSHKTYQTVFDGPLLEVSILMQLCCGHVTLCKHVPLEDQGG